MVRSLGDPGGGGGGLCVCWEWVGAPMWVGTGVYMDAYVHVFVLMLNYSSILLYENFTWSHSRVLSSVQALLLAAFPDTLQVCQLQKRMNRLGSMTVTADSPQVTFDWKGSLRWLLTGKGPSLSSVWPALRMQCVVFRFIAAGEATGTDGAWCQATVGAEARAQAGRGRSRPCPQSQLHRWRCMFVWQQFCEDFFRNVVFGVFWGVVASC